MSTLEPPNAPDVAGLTPPERRTAAQALREITRHLGGARAVEVYGAAGSLGAALAARLAQEAGAPGPILYVCADEATAEARAADLSFFLPHAAAADDPLAPPPALLLPAPEASPYAEMQPDRRSLLARMGMLFRLSQGR